MSSLTPPSQAKRSIGLDERLGLAGQRVRVPGRTGDTVSASLAHMPSQMAVLYGLNEHNAPVLELRFDFLEDIKEAKKAGLVEASDRRYAVEVSVGEQSGRIYRIAMMGVDLTDESVRAVTGGIVACFKDHVRYHNPSLRQQAIFHSMSILVARMLPSLVGELRRSADAPPDCDPRK